MSEFTVIEKIEYKDYEIEIWQDHYLDEFNNPRSWDNVAKMICWHPEYTLGDEQINPNHYDSIEEILDDLGIEDAVMLPLFLIDHSGIAMNVGGYSFVDPEGWDWGQVGIIYITSDMAIEAGLGDATDEQLNGIMRDEVSVYSSYLEGDIVGYSVFKNGEIQESVGGFVGSYDHCVEEAKSFVDYSVTEDEKEAEAERYWACRDIVTV